MTSLRRDILRLSAGGAMAAVTGRAHARPVPYRYSYQPPLRQTAAKKHVYYGACVSPAWLDVGKDTSREFEPDFSVAFARECNILVGEGATKWNALHPAPDRWDFSQADLLLKYADANAMKMRGHTLIWHASLPDWAQNVLIAGKGEALMEAYINTVMAHFKGRFMSWDVVNEALNPKGAFFSDGLRDTPWLRALGPGYIERAFRLAAAADPGVQLVYNDYDLEARQSKADAALGLLRRLKDKGVPVHAVGLQAHFDTETRFDHLDAFCIEVRKLGLDIIITEMDVFETDAGMDPARSDLRIAAKTREFLDRVFSVTVPKQILTWGLSDRHSWLSSAKWNAWRNPAGRHIRGLPLDDDLHRTAMWGVLDDFIGKI